MARKSTKTARKPIDTVQLKLRFSEALRRRLAQEAKQRNCSLNTEIVTRLENSLLGEKLIKVPLTEFVANALLAYLDKDVVSELALLFLERAGKPAFSKSEVSRAAREYRQALRESRRRPADEDGQRLRKDQK
jgi:hypothetical protein